jgi:hypothetical protein
MANNPIDEITSDFDESVNESEFTSITSSRVRYVYEHGRYVKPSLPLMKALA